MNDEYDPDDYEDELMRILEGRDVEEDVPDVSVEKSKSTKASSKKQRIIVSADEDEIIPEREDDDLENFIENDYEEGEEPEDARENREDEAKEVPAKRVKGPRRVTLNPRPKLDADRLKSKRGLVALLDLHPQIQLKGEGHEEADLDAIMFALEHWAHRLFPKLAFDDFIEKAESLGGKRLVTTFLRKIRMDMPLDVTDELVPQEDENEDDNDERGPVTAESLFDEIVGASNATTNDQVSSGNEATPANITPSVPASLTEDQRALIARKRLEAIERRKQKEAEAERDTESSQLVSADEMFALMNTDM